MIKQANRNFKVMLENIHDPLNLRALLNSDSTQFLISSFGKYFQANILALNIVLRIELFGKEWEALIAESEHTACNSGNKIKEFNKRVCAYRDQPDNILSCLTSDISMLNRQCVARKLDGDSLSLAMSPMNEHCGYDEQLECKTELLATTNDENRKKLQESKCINFILKNYYRYALEENERQTDDVPECSRNNCKDS